MDNFGDIYLRNPEGGRGGMIVLFGWGSSDGGGGGGGNSSFRGGGGAGMHQKGRGVKNGATSGKTGGWRRLPKRLWAVTVGYKCHRGRHLASGTQWLGEGWAPWRGGYPCPFQCISGGGRRRGTFLSQ